MFDVGAKLSGRVEVENKTDDANNNAVTSNLDAEKLFESVRIVLARKGVKAERKYEQSILAVFVNNYTFLSFEQIVSEIAVRFGTVYGDKTQMNMRSFINSLVAQGILEEALQHGVKYYRPAVEVLAEILAKYNEMLESANADVSVEELAEKLVEDEDAYMVSYDNKYFIATFDLTYLHVKYEKLYEELERDFDNIRDKIAKLIAKKFERDEKLVRVYFVNAVKQKRLHDIDENDVYNFVTVTASISFINVQKNFYRKTVFVCKDCGEEHVLLQYPYAKVVKPDRCSACGSRHLELDVLKSVRAKVVQMLIEDAYETLSADEEKKEFEAYMVYPPSNIDTLVNETVKLTVLIRDKALLKLGNDATAPIYVEVVGIEKLQQTDVKVDAKIVESVRKKKEQVAGNDTKKWIKYLIENTLPARVVEPEGSGYLHDLYVAYTSMLLSVVSDKELRDDDATTCVNVLVAGDRGVGKSSFAEALRKMKLAVYLSATNVTRGGVTGIVEQREGFGWVYRKGAVFDARNSTLIIDEADKLSEEDYTTLLNIMSNGHFTFRKADVKIDTTVLESVIFLMNPKNGRFNNLADAFAQIQIKRAELLDRFSLIVFLRDTRTAEERKKILLAKKQYLLKREHGEATTDFEFVKQALHVARKLNVRFTDEAFDVLVEEVSRIEQLLHISECGFKYSVRLFDHLYNIARAFAKIDLSDTVTPKHVKLASELFAEAVKTWGVELAELLQYDNDTLMNDAFIYIKRVAKKIDPLLAKRKFSRELVVEELSDYTSSRAVAEKIVEKLIDAGWLEEVEENNKKMLIFNFSLDD